MLKLSNRVSKQGEAFSLSNARLHVTYGYSNMFALILIICQDFAPPEPVPGFPDAALLGQKTPRGRAPKCPNILNLSERLVWQV